MLLCINISRHVGFSRAMEYSYIVFHQIPFAHSPTLYEIYEYENYRA